MFAVYRGEGWLYEVLGLNSLRRTLELLVFRGQVSSLRILSVSSSICPLTLPLLLIASVMTRIE